MATLTLRIDTYTRDQVEAMARARGITVSQLLRIAIDDLLGLDRDGDRPREDGPASLTMVERRMLAMQHEILSRLDADDDHEVTRRTQHIRALIEGYAGEYGHEFADLYPEMSRRDCELVWDILDMFQTLKASASRLGSSEVATLGDDADWALTFPGFDGNDDYEVRLLGYADFLISTAAGRRWLSASTPSTIAAIPTRLFCPHICGCTPRSSR